MNPPLNISNASNFHYLMKKLYFSLFKNLSNFNHGNISSLEILHEGKTDYFECL